MTRRSSLSAQPQSGAHDASDGKPRASCASLTFGLTIIFLRGTTARSDDCGVTLCPVRPCGVPSSAGRPENAEKGSVPGKSQARVCRKWGLAFIQRISPPARRSDWSAGVCERDGKAHGFNAVERLSELRDACRSTRHAAESDSAEVNPERVRFDRLEIDITRLIGDVSPVIVIELAFAFFLFTPRALRFQSQSVGFVHAKQKRLAVNFLNLFYGRSVKNNFVAEDICDPRSMH